MKRLVATFAITFVCICSFYLFYSGICYTLIVEATCKERYSIGIYTGSDLFNLNNIKNNPVLTYKDVKDIPAGFVADPFMVKEKSKWYMFFEVYNLYTKQGDIGYAVSEDGFKWVYKQIVLDEKYSISFPHVFKLNDNYYMVPETYASGFIRLYRAESFPTKWVFVKNLIKGNFTDPSLFQYNGKWWVFVSVGKDLSIFYADDLLGPYFRHPKTPISVTSVDRSAGRIISYNGYILRFVQNGANVFVIRMTNLSTENFEEEIFEEPLLEATGLGWNAKGMHHIDFHQIDENKWIACVDGWG